MKPNRRKRQRYTEEDKDSDTKIKLNGSERAKIHRERKKKYYADLEIENKKLNSKISELTIQNQKLHMRIEELENKLNGGIRNQPTKLQNQSMVKLPQLNTFFKLDSEEEKNFICIKEKVLAEEINQVAKISTGGEIQS